MINLHTSEYKEGMTHGGQTVVYGHPPNYVEIANRFPISGLNVVFSYGDKVYASAGLPVPYEIMVHENVHGQRQDLYGVEKWWDEYLRDDTFRMMEEIDGHAAELMALQDMAINRRERRGYEAMVSKKLASPMYGFHTSRLKLRDALRHEIKEVRHAIR